MRLDGDDGMVKEGTLRIGEPFALRSGGVLPVVDVAWRMVGPSGAPLVVALGGISAHRRVYGASGDAPGWWQLVAGPGGSLGSERFRVLSFDYLGGSGDSTGPTGGHFPSVTTHDQATVLRHLLGHLGIPRIDALVGASYGGMVGLAFAESFPQSVRRLVVISGAHRTDPLSTAWRSMQRQIIRLGLSAGRGAEALRIARGLAMATYRSREEFVARFTGEPTRERADAPFVFPVESYLLARGEDYARRHAPGGFLCLSESIDLHRIDPARVRVPVDAVAVLEDQLVPVADMRTMVERLPRARLTEISSPFGHDAFLKEREALRPVFERLLEESP